MWLWDSKTRWPQMHLGPPTFRCCLPLCCLLVASISSVRGSGRSGSRFKVQRWVSLNFSNGLLGDLVFGFMATALCYGRGSRFLLNYFLKGFGIVHKLGFSMIVERIWDRNIRLDLASCFKNYYFCLFICNFLWNLGFSRSFLVCFVVRS